MNELLHTQFESVGFEKEFGFQLLKMEDVFSFTPSTKKNPFKPHRINFFTVLLLVEGEMTHEVDFIKYKMTGGDCLFISKGQIHKFDKSPTYKGYGLIFTEEFIIHHVSPSAYSKINLLYNHHLNPSRFKDFGDRDIIVHSLKRELSLEQGKIKADVIAALLTVLLLKAQLNITNKLKSDNEQYDQFRQFQKFVAAKYMDTRAAKDYAIFLNITYKQLNKLCTAFTEKTAKEYISDYMMLEAKRQLATTNLPVKQIAFACGFKEVTNFLKFFKKNTDTTPMQFRKSRS
ncbi:MAG: helix-turn-helix transcriptional regulator [Bacteroidota bacterium]